MNHLWDGIQSPNPDFPQEIKRVVGRTCRNLFNHNYPVTETKSGVTLTNNGDGTITLNGTVTSAELSFALNSNTTIQNYGNSSDLVHTAYYVSGTCTKVSSSQSRTVIRLNYDAGRDKMIPLQDLSTQQVISKVFPQREGDAGWSWTVTLGQGDIFDNFTIKYQLEKGTKPSKYEPYYEGKAIKINECNKNIFNNIWEKGMIGDSTGNYSANDNMARTPFGEMIKVKPNVQYVFNGVTERIYEYDENKNFLNVIKYEASTDFVQKTRIFTTSSNTYYVAFRHSLTSPNTPYTTISQLKALDMQLEEGAVATSYEPHQEKTFLLNIGDMELCKRGNAEDFFFKNTTDNLYYNSDLVENGWYKYEAIGKVIGSSQFNSNGIDDNRVGLITQTLNIEANLLDLSQMTYCNLLTTTQRNYSGLNGTTAGNKIRVYVSTKYASTFAEAKQLLEDIIIYYVQLTPTYTQITDTTLISQLEEISKFKCYYGVNHIWSEIGEIDANLILNYYKSNKLRLDNIEARLELLEE